MGLDYEVLHARSDSTMGLKKLGQEFVDYEVVHATGIEVDIVDRCHDFCLEHLADYGKESICYDMVEILCTEDYEGLAYFVHEKLPDFMNSVAPIGCYFGSHRGDGTRGFWQIIDKDIVLSDFEDAKRLPYKHSGYNILPYDNDFIGQDLDCFDSFFNAQFWDIYTYSELSAIDDMVTINQDSDDYEHAKLIKGFIIDKIMPLIAPKGFVWRVNERGDYGLFKELPGYVVAKGSIEYIETITQLRMASDIVRLTYILDNKQGGELCTAGKDLLPICINIVNAPHFVPFYQSYNSCVSLSRSDIAEYLTEHYSGLNWAIDKLFLDDFKVSVDRILGNQDVTRLWSDIMRHADGKIDGIRFDDIFSLRESCGECEDIDDIWEDDTWDSRECGCSTYDDLNSVWLIGDKYFYKELKAQGAMVYESDSYYFYLQTSYSFYDDGLLRKAWLISRAQWHMDILEKTRNE